MTTIWVLLVSGNIHVGDVALFAAYRTRAACSRERTALASAFARCDRVRIVQQ